VKSTNWMEKSTCWYASK